MSAVAAGEELSPRVRALRERWDRVRRSIAGTGPWSREQDSYPGYEPFHQAWLEHEGDPFPVRLAQAQAAWRAAVQPELVPGHLVAGTPPPRTVISYPTGVFAWDFRIDEEVLARHPEAEPAARYWREWRAGRPGPELPGALGTPGLSDALWTSGIGCHSTQAYELALEGGLAGLRERVAAARPGHPEAADWYRALEVALEGVAGYILAHARAAEEAAAGAGGEQGAEWRRLAADCRWIAQAPPATFLQAVQLFELLFLLNGHDSPGRLDQYLWPPLRRDLEAGRTSLEAAQEVVDCLYLKLAEHVCYGATLGGQLSEGGDATNELTWLCLHSIRRLRLLSPRTALRWHRGTPEPLFAATIHSLATGATFPTLVNDEAMLPGLVGRGLAPEHARDYTFCGCGQTTPQGRAYGGYEDLILNSVKPLTYALHDGRDERTGAQVGPRTGEPGALGSFEAVEAAVWAQVEHLLTLGIAATAAWRRWGAEQVPDFLRSLLTHSCVERGRDWRAGGADYHEGMVDLVGLPTLADALTAIRQVVFVERQLSLAELVAILDRDWAGAERLRRDCLRRVPKFGNEQPEADGMMARWLGRINDWLGAQRTAFGGPWGVDIIGWSASVAMGEITGATPDGRRAGEPIADCAGPAQGRDRAGVTAVLNSMLTLPMDRCHGPLALSLRVSGQAVGTPQGEAKLGALVRRYLEGGGQQVQVSVASAAQMRAAQADPEAHRDLVVRVGGFSAYFVELEPRYQADMIARTEHTLG